MAWRIQFRRDTRSNWEKVKDTVTLAQGEVGFIVPEFEYDENGKLLPAAWVTYKIGDGVNVWKDLKEMGFTGEYSNEEISKILENDENITASRAAIRAEFEKITADYQAKYTELADKLGNLAEGTTVADSLENLQININEVDKKYNDLINGTDSYIDPDTGDEIPAKDGIEKRLQDTETSLDVLLGDKSVEGSVDYKVKTAVDGVLDGVSIDFDTLKEVETYITKDKADMQSLQDLTASHSTSIEKHEKDIYGWDEEVVTGTDEETGEEIKETVHHDSIDEKIDKVETKVTDEVTRLDEKIDTMHQIMTEKEYVGIQDFSVYPEGTLIFTYKEE